MQARGSAEAGQLVRIGHGVDAAHLLAVRGQLEDDDGDVRLLDAWEDAVRMAATHRDAALWARLGEGAGVTQLK